MNATIAILGAVFLLAFLYVLVPTFVRAYVRSRGKRVVTCPENHLPAGVEVDARRAALSSLFGPQTMRLDRCTRWPEKEGCGQECLREIETAHDGCLVREVLSRWFEKRHCALCAAELTPITWSRHHPALLGRDGRTVEWSDVDPSKLNEMFATHRPVCWSCHIVETFRREHCDLVIVRPGHDLVRPNGGRDRDEAERREDRSSAHN